MAEFPAGVRTDRPPDLEKDSEAVSDLLLALASAPERDPASLVPLGPGASSSNCSTARPSSSG